jgi:cathepsin L
VFKAPCGSDVDHAIVLVGYGTDPKDGDYWLIRNSWSAGWGEDGYIRLARYGESKAGEPCKTDNTPGDGDGCKGGPSSIQVCGICGIMSDSSYPTGASL